MDASKLLDPGLSRWSSRFCSLITKEWQESSCHSMLGCVTKSTTFTYSKLKTRDHLVASTDINIRTQKWTDNSLLQTNRNY